MTRPFGWCLHHQPSVTRHNTTLKMTLFPNNNIIIISILMNCGTYLSTACVLSTQAAGITRHNTSFTQSASGGTKGPLYVLDNGPESIVDSSGVAVVATRWSGQNDTEASGQSSDSWDEFWLTGNGDHLCPWFWCIKCAHRLSFIYLFYWFNFRSLHPAASVSGLGDIDHAGVAWHCSHTAQKER